MLAFSEGLGRLDSTDWEPHPIGQAPAKLARIATEAAFSRVRPVADGPNQWELQRQSAGTVGSLSPGAPLVGTGLGTGTGSTDTCDSL
jgi:hypothetical protein